MHEGYYKCGTAVVCTVYDLRDWIEKQRLAGYEIYLTKLRFGDVSSSNNDIRGILHNETNVNVSSWVCFRHFFPSSAIHLLICLA